MTINRAGLDLIKSFESLRLKAYRDPVGIWTVGYGHTGPDVYPGLEISKPEAEQLLADDLRESEEGVRELVAVPLNDNQFAALVSFAFNAGGGALKGSTLRRKLNKKDYKGAAGEFPKWIYGTIKGKKVLLPGLVRRRAQERNLFLNLPVVLEAAPRMAISPGPIAAGAKLMAARDSSGDYDTDFTNYVQALGLKYFKPYEFLIMGHQHSNPNSPAFGLNKKPPQKLWPRIGPTAHILDRARELLGAPIMTLSVYRSPEYNKKIAGATHSEHMNFTAIDFQVKANSGPAEWAGVLRQMRQSGLFKGGIGVYPSFVHVDTRGVNRDW
ncbi:MAG: glycoside hydrolase family protein [Methyloceanibacter sp.]|jgi:lysozyme